MGAFAKAMNTTTGAAVEVFSHTGAQPAVFANGRPQPATQYGDLPEPVDVGDKTGDLDAAEAELFHLCELALDELFTAERVAIRALANIHGRRLYRATHATFEDYCQERFDRGRLWAHRQIEALWVSEALFPMGNTVLPTTQSREIAPTLRDHGVEAAQEQYRTTAETGSVTGKRLRENRPTAKPERATVKNDTEIVDAELVEDGLTERLLTYKIKRNELSKITAWFEGEYQQMRADGPEANDIINAMSRHGRKIDKITKS